MNRLITFTLTALLMVLVGSCSKKSSNPPDDDPTQKELQRIDSLMTTQVALESTLQGLFTQLDSTAAKDSIVKILTADPNVQEAQSTSQGITIQYTNGVRGGIFLDPEDGLMPSRKIGASPVQALGTSSTAGHKPGSKKTRFLNPSYSERWEWADPLVVAANTAFAKAGYDAFESLLNQACRVDQFASLSGYGIVHIYSHGFAWPNNVHIEEVYVLTGEVESPATTAKYLADIEKGRVLMGAYDGLNRYYINPSFVAAHNDFHDDTALVYLGFCYSFCGGWQDTLTRVAGAGACVGFDWHVDTRWNAAWARHMYTQMCDTSLTSAMTIYNWWYAESDTDNTFWDNHPDCQRWINVESRGYDDLVLWSMVKIASISPESGAVDIPLTIRGSGFGYSQGTSTVTISGLVAAVSEWSDTLIVAEVPTEATSGIVVVTVGGQPSNSVYFRVTDPSHTLAPFTSQHTFKIYGPNNTWDFEFVFDFALNGSVEGPGLVTESDTTMWPYPDTEPMNRYKNYYGTVGGPTPAEAAVQYSLQSMANGHDASGSSMITLTKSYPSGDHWEVTLTPVFQIGYWKDSDTQYSMLPYSEAPPINCSVVIGDRSHVIINRRFDVHAVLHLDIGIDYTYDYWPSYNIAGFTFEHR